MTAIEPLKNWQYIVGEESYSVRVPEYSDETLRAATDVIGAAFFGLYRREAPRAFAWLESVAVKSTMRQHTTDPWDGDCGCEGADWWCADGDSEPVMFWAVERADIQRFHDRAHTEQEAIQ